MASNLQHPNPQTPEAIALVLLTAIAGLEGKSKNYISFLPINTDREWILSTYRECLKAVRQAED